jgi:hypothetical protein
LENAEVNTIVEAALHRRARASSIFGTMNDQMLEETKEAGGKEHEGSAERDGGIVEVITLCEETLSPRSSPAHRSRCAKKL